MSVQITMELTDEKLSALDTTPDQFFQEMRLAAAVKWYELGSITQSRATELAGVSRQGFLDALARFRVSPFQTTPQKLATELARE